MIRSAIAEPGMESLVPYECPVCQYPDLEAKPDKIWPPPEDMELSPPYGELLGTPS